MPAISRADRKAVYASRACRLAFTKPQNAQLRQTKPIGAVIRRHNLRVWPYSNDQLSAVLRSLLRDGVFESSLRAQDFFPELFPQRSQLDLTVAAPSVEAESSDNRTTVIMELQDTLQKGLLASLKSLFSTGDYSDLTVIAGKQYRLHRNLICERSRPLAAACRYNQANKSDEHENTLKDVLNLTDDDPHAIDCMLQFFYHLNYDPAEFGPVTEGANLDSPRVLVLHARIYAVAEKYMVDGLKALAMEKFERATASRLNKDDFLEAAREAYTTTIASDRGLRDIVVKVFHAHKQSLLDKEEAVELLTEVPLLAVHLLRCPDQRRPGYF